MVVPDIIRQVLTNNPEYMGVAEAIDGEGAVQQAQKQKPEAFVTDIPRRNRILVSEMWVFPVQLIFATILYFGHAFRFRRNASRKKAVTNSETRIRIMMLESPTSRDAHPAWRLRHSACTFDNQQHADPRRGSRSVKNKRGRVTHL
jgi:DNA-binding NarL/FixJ family response regulator